MDVQALIAAEMKKKKDDAKPRVFLMKVDTVPAFSKSDDSVFRVRGTNVETGEPLFLIAVKSAKGQAVPKPGDILRADKATPDGAIKVEGAPSGVPLFRAKYFHTYENGFCLNAVMQPMPVRTNDQRMVSAQVLAYDPKASGQLLNGAELQTKLVATIANELKPWAFKNRTALTHDVGGKPVWGGGPVQGVAPVAVVRFMGNSFKVFGAGALFKNRDNKAEGLRFPTDAEVIAMVEKNPGVQNLLTTISTLKAKGLTDDQLQTVEVAVLPGMALSVGRDKITFSAKKDEEYFNVPAIYKVADKEHGTTFNGHRESFIHLKQTRTERLNVVDTSPAPGGKLSPQLPPFEVELAAARHRAGQAAAAAVTGNDQAPQRTREQALAVDDFDEPAPAAPQARPAPAQHVADTQTAETQSQAAQTFDEDEYDFSGLDEDMSIIESLNTGLGESALAELFDQAERHSAARTPRMG